jgi:hypothetical protein
MAARCSRDFMVGRNIDAVVHQIRREMAAAYLAKADGAADGLIADRQQGTPKATTEMLADQDRGVQRKLMRREGVDAFISRATTRVQIRRCRGRR